MKKLFVSIVLGGLLAGTSARADVVVVTHRHHHHHHLYGHAGMVWVPGHYAGHWWNKHWVPGHWQPT